MKLCGRGYLTKRITKHNIREFIMFKKFIRNEEGATAIEYGLIAAGIAVAISAVVFTFGSDLAQLFTDMAAKISGA
jgi:pilus assembly protein Flp/PilA